MQRFFELLVGKDAQHVVERGIPLLQERHENVAQDVLHAHAPRVRPHLLEDIHHAGSGESDTILPDMAKWIVTERLVRIGGVEIDDVIPRNSGTRAAIRATRSPCGSISAKPLPRSRS